MSSSYSSQFKQDAVKLAVESDQSVAQTARDLILLKYLVGENGRFGRCPTGSAAGVRVALSANGTTLGEQSIRRGMKSTFWSSVSATSKRWLVSSVSCSEKQEYVPTTIVTDKLRSYRVALRELSARVPHVTGRYQNNRTQLSHQPTR